MPFEHAGASWYDEEIRCIFEALPDIILVISCDGTILKHHANDPGLLAAAPEAFLGRKAAEVLPPGIAGRLMKLIHAALSSGKQQRMTYKIPTISKGIRDSEARLVPCGEDKVLLLIRDMTDYMEAERGRMEAEARTGDLRRELDER